MNSLGAKPGQSSDKQQVNEAMKDEILHSVHEDWERRIDEIHEHFE